jgi:3-oxoacyl-[acyl-carrier-protein] synthase III
MRHLDKIRYKFGIAGSAVALPRCAIPSTHVDKISGQAQGATEAQFKIANRYWAEPDETSSLLASKAAQAALDQADWDPMTVDAIIGACGVMEQPIPGTAAIVQRRLGLGDSGIAAFDINATCLSFLMAFDRALAGFALGEWRRVLVFSADIASAALDFSEPEASVIFGDGAAAFALSSDGPHERLAHLFQTFGDAADVCRLEAGGTRLRPHEDMHAFLAGSKFQMDGKSVFKATALRFPAFLDALLDKAGVEPAEIETIVPHQASAAALEHLKRSLPGGHMKTIDIFSKYGNQIATSLPHALHVARTTGRLAPGSTSLLVGTSAGVSLGERSFVGRGARSCYRSHRRPGAHHGRTTMC